MQNQRQLNIRYRQLTALFFGDILNDCLQLLGAVILEINPLGGAVFSRKRRA